MTREEAQQILIHHDDLVWQQDNHITCGMISEALNLATDALNPWHKVSEELPKVDKYQKCVKVFARRGDDVYVAFYSPICGFSLSSSFYTEYMLSNIEYWMPIPEIKED